MHEVADKRDVQRLDLVEKTANVFQDGALA